LVVDACVCLALIVLTLHAYLKLFKFSFYVFSRTLCLLFHHVNERF